MVRQEKAALSFSPGFNGVVGGAVQIDSQPFQRFSAPRTVETVSARYDEGSLVTRLKPGVNQSTLVLLFLTVLPLSLASLDAL